MPSLFTHILKAFIQAHRDGIWHNAEKIERSSLHPAAKWKKLRKMGVCRYCVMERIGSIPEEIQQRREIGITTYPRDYSCKGCRETLKRKARAHMAAIAMRKARVRQ